MTETTTADAAARLGVSQRQVQRLVNAGRVAARRTAGDAWLVDALAVNTLSRTRPGRGRPWEPPTAWGALWLLSGLDAPWIDRRTMSRLSARLRQVDAETLVHMCRGRATTLRCRVAESFVDELHAALVLSGTSTGLVDASRTDGYCDAITWESLSTRLHLVADPRGNATIRITPFVDVLHDRTVMPPAVTAADLAESYEVRERTSGLHTLTAMLR